MLTNSYYSFVDRDMYMQYAGGGVGYYKIDVNDPHTVTQEPVTADDETDDESDEEGEDNEDKDEEDEDGDQEDDEDDEEDEDKDEEGTVEGTMEDDKDK